MDNLESQIAGEIEMFYTNTSKDEVKRAAFDLIEFYKLVVNIIQKNQLPNSPENTCLETQK